jgi:aminoglycoside phosphotransferase (APT) family kinase protein
LATAAPAARRRIVHGDLYSCHVLVVQPGIGGIIDWGDVHRGDPALDLSLGYSWFDRNQRRRFFDAYGGVDADTERRARFRSLYYGLVLLEYGTSEGRNDIVVCARQALAGGL